MATLAEVLAGTGQVEFVGKFEYRNPSTDTVSVFYVSFGGTVLSTGSGDEPPSETFPARLKDPGTLDYRLSVDLQFSGLAQVELGPVVLDNVPAGENIEGPYDLLSAFTFAGRDYTLYGGAANAAFSTFEVVASGRFHGEPQISATEARFNLQSPMEMLNVPLRVNRYVGIPTAIKWLTSSGGAVAPHIADYDLTSFTLISRIRMPSEPTSLATLWLKQISSADRNFYGALNTLGGIDCYASIAGVNTLIVSSDDNWADGADHIVVWSLSDKSESYLMIGGVVVGLQTALADSVDTQTADVLFGHNLINGLSFDVRIYNHYMTPDEARAVTGTRIDGDETGVVAYWTGDDGSGSIATDYSANANHAALSGVENTDYEWAPTDLGMSEQAGQAMPIAHGIIANAPADLVDSVLERYRIDDGVSNTLALLSSLIVRSKGAPLATPADYTSEGSGVLQMTGSQDEPVTFAYPDPSEAGASYADLLAEYIVRRGGFDAADLSSDALDELRMILPFDSGWFLGGQQGQQSALLSADVQEILAGGGAHLRLGPTGLLTPGYVLAPISPGPYGSEPVIDFHGTGTVNLGDVGSVTGAHSIVFWMKSLTFGLEARGLDVTLLTKPNLYSYVLGTDGSIRVEYSTLTPLAIRSSPNILPIELWRALCVTYDDVSGERNLYIADKEGTSVLLATDTTTGTLVGSSDDLLVGGFIGSGAYVQVWDRELTQGEFSLLAMTPPVPSEEANLTVYAPMTEGSGSVVEELVNDGVGLLSSRCTWAPKVVYDLSATHQGVDFEPRSLVPAWRAVVGYAENFRPMSPSEIAPPPTVSKADALQFKRERALAPAESADVLADYPGANGNVFLKSPLAKRSQAQALARNILTRLGPNRVGGILSNAGRDSILLDLTDEIRIVSYRFGLALGRSYRVIQKRVRYGALTSDLELWGSGPVAEELQLLTEEGEVLLTEAGEEILLG